MPGVFDAHQTRTGRGGEAGHHAALVCLALRLVAGPAQRQHRGAQIRQAAGRSRIQCDALGPARVACFDAETLSGLMLREPSMQAWGDHTLCSELMRRAERDWAPAALPARERLPAFRCQFPGLEDRVAHHHMASYLGTTPVSLSRLRAQMQE